MRKLTLLCGIAFAAAFQHRARANEVSGWMMVAGQRSEFHHVVAVAAPSMFYQDSRKDLVIVFSEEPVTAREVLDNKLTSRWYDGELNALLLRIQPWDKQVVSGNLFARVLSPKGQQVSGNAMANITFTRLEANRVEGHATQKRYPVFDTHLDVDATFAADVEAASLDLKPPDEPSPVPEKKERKKIEGKPLPANGGEPGIAFRAFVKALHSGSTARVRKYLVPAFSTAPDLETVLPLLRELLPANAKITGGTWNDKEAEIEYENAKQKGYIDSIRGKDGWRFDMPLPR